MKEGYKTFISSDGFEILVGNQGGVDFAIVPGVSRHPRS